MSHPSALSPFTLHRPFTGIHEGAGRHTHLGLLDVQRLHSVFLNTDSLRPSHLGPGAWLVELKSARESRTPQHRYSSRRSLAMTSPEGVPVNAKLAYVVLYVDDVDRSLDFYSKVFDLQARKENRSHSWIELETGSTTLALTPKKQREADITGGVQSPAALGEAPRPNIDVSFSVYDVNQCLERANKAGGKVLAKPEPKDWGQTVAYVSDPDGITVSVGSHIAHV